MIYENARFRAFSGVNLFLNGILLFLAFWTDTMKDDVITGEVKSMGISDSVLKTSDIIHVHIKEASAYAAFHMAVVLNDVVKAVGTARDFKPTNFAHFRQQIQISIYGCLADRWMLPDDLLINLICCGVAMQSIHCLQDQGALDGMTSCHGVHLIDIYFLLIIYIINEKKVKSQFWKFSRIPFGWFSASMPLGSSRCLAGGTETNPPYDRRMDHMEDSQSYEYPQKGRFLVLCFHAGAGDGFGGFLQHVFR